MAVGAIKRGSNFDKPAPAPVGPSLLGAFATKADSVVTQVQQQSVDFAAWALWLPESKTGTLNFRRFPFQRELYNTGFDDEEIVVKKASQVGISAWALRWIMAHADRKGRTGLYVFPTQNDVYDFSDARIKPVIDASSYLQGRIREDAVQNKGLRQIGAGLVYFRGSESKSGAQSVDADVMVLDEYDLLDPMNLPDLEQRIQGPLSASLLRRIGNPSDEDWGIDRSFGGSDQRFWHVRCEGCGERQPIDYDANVDEVAVQIVCRKCRKPLNLFEGEWVAKHPSRDVKGYHLSRLMVPSEVPGVSHKLKTVIANHQIREPYRKKIHMNKDLGIAWSPGEARLQTQVLRAAQSIGGEFGQLGNYSGKNWTTMGVDVASSRNLHVRISTLEDNGRRGVFIREVENFNEVAHLIDRFQVNCCLVDSMPERRMAGGLVQRYPGRVFLVAFSGTQKDILKVDPDTAMVTVRKVEAIDAMVEQLRAGRNYLPQDLPDDYVDHLQAITRITEEDETGKRTVYWRSSGPDDFAMAETYDLIAHEVFRIVQYAEHTQEEVLTTLDDHLEFERAKVDDPDDLSYSAGPPEPETPDW